MIRLVRSISQDPTDIFHIYPVLIRYIQKILYKTLPGVVLRMNAQMFYISLVFAVLVLGLFSFLVGGKSEKAKTQRVTNDEIGFQNSIMDLVKIACGSIVVLTVSIFGLATLLVISPQSVLVSPDVIGNPINFLAMVFTGLFASMAGGFYLGVNVQGRIEKKESSRSHVPLIPVLSVMGMIALVSRAAAATPFNMTDSMGPITEIMGWAGNSFVPAVIVLVIAVVPLIMILLGVRFAGGMMTALMEGVKDIFSFRF